MDDKELVNNTNNNVNTYRATTNLNTAIENPQLNINSAIGVNIQDSVNNNNNNFNTSEVNNYQNDTFSSNNYTDNTEVDSTVTSFINANNSVNDVNLPVGDNSNVTNNVVSDSNNVNNNSDYVATGDVSGNYEPTMDGKKRKGFNITISKELKMMIFIIFILVIFVMTIPSIYDFFKNLGFVISG